MTGSAEGRQGRDGSGPGLRIVSGGQTGADRAALDAALAAGVPCGGWCPAGRWAEDGPIDRRYPLTETPEPDPIARTLRNVADSDATLILTLGAPDAGTHSTETAAGDQGRPCLTLDLSSLADEDAAQRMADWIVATGIRTLNVAGPRESNAPGLQARARAVIDAALRLLLSRPR